MNAYLPENLKKIRMALGFNKIKMGIAMGLNRMTYTNYESGATTPDVYFVLELSKKFGFTVEELCEQPIASEADLAKRILKQTMSREMLP